MGLLSIILIHLRLIWPDPTRFWNLRARLNLTRKSGQPYIIWKYLHRHLLCWQRRSGLGWCSPCPVHCTQWLISQQCFHHGEVAMPLKYWDSAKRNIKHNNQIMFLAIIIPHDKLLLVQGLSSYSPYVFMKKSNEIPNFLTNSLLYLLKFWWKNNSNK